MRRTEQLLGLALLGSLGCGGRAPAGQDPLEPEVEITRVEPSLDAATTETAEAQRAEGAQPSPVPRAQTQGDEDATTRAAALFQEGLLAYQVGDFPRSLRAFLSAYETKPTWQVLYNIAQVHLALGDPAAAATTLERYLREGGSDIDPARRQEVDAELKRLRAGLKTP